MRKLAAILLWSVITAAFIGPGTVTTAASSGASFGLALLWALLFSTVACFVLQEASARLTVVSDKSLGTALGTQYPKGLRRAILLGLALGAVVIGCAAYEAGNILGGVAGAALAVDISPKLLTLFFSGVAASLLWFQNLRVVARLLSAVVAIMGVAFLITAWQVKPAVDDVLHSILVPTIPPSSGMLVLGLIGTTVVPYNLFMGSALAHGERLSETRLGLAVAIGFGGIISIGVLVAGTAVEGNFTFDGMSTVLTDQLGVWSRNLFAIGLLGAGLSSAITAPLAAAITAAEILRRDSQDSRWRRDSWRYRTVWLGVLGTGTVFGLSNVKPIPAILLAQALNGLVLPVVAIFLLRVVNDHRIMGKNINGVIGNLAMVVVTFASLLLGVSTFSRAGTAALGIAAPQPAILAIVSVLVAALIAVPLIRGILKVRPPSL